MNYTDILFNKLAHKSTIQDLLDYSRIDIFNNPIMLTNASFCVISLSYENDFEDRVWNEGKNNGKFSDETIELFKNDHNSNELFMNHKSFIYKTGLGAKIPRILSPIGEHPMYGYIVIFEVNRKLTEEDVHNATILSKALMISNNTTSSINEISMEDYDYYQLLDKRQNHTLIENKQGNYVVCSASLPKDKKNEKYIDHIRNKIVFLDPSIHCFQYRDNLFILINYDSLSQYNLNIDHIRSILDKYKLQMGISNTFHNIYDLPVYFKQATKTRLIGSHMENSSMYHYDSYLLPMLFANMRRDDLSAMISNDYRLLKEYDHKHNSEFILTLYAYYLNSMNTELTSKYLFVHRNTINYRLTTMEQKLHIKYYDMKVLSSILLSKRIDDYLSFK